MKKKYDVTLTQEERQMLQAMLSRGKAAARKLMHARILLKAEAAAGGPELGPVQGDRTDDLPAVALSLDDEGDRLVGGEDPDARAAGPPVAMTTFVALKRTKPKFAEDSFFLSRATAPMTRFAAPVPSVSRAITSWRSKTRTFRRRTSAARARNMRREGSGPAEGARWRGSRSGLYPT